MNKFKFLFVWLLFCLFWLVNFSFGGYPISYNFDSPIVFSSNQFSFSSSTNINYLFYTVSHSAEKYFCVSNLYLATNQTNINNYLWDLTFYNCYDSQNLTADLELQDCYKLQTSYWTTNPTDYQTTWYNCYQLQWRDGATNTYVYVSRSLTWWTNSATRNATVYNSIIDFNLLSSNRQLFNQNFCTTNNLCPSCPSQYTSEQCQSEYSLIPVSSVDQSYCENNDLCSVCDNLTWDLVFSNVYINNILHPWRSNIYVNIPDYINWDYSVSDIDFNINVGSGYDEDYINSVIDINSYRPTSSDFTNVFVSGLTLIFPYIIFALFILFMWKLIKRIFK